MHQWKCRVLLRARVSLAPNDATCDGVDDNCNGIADEDFTGDVLVWLGSLCQRRRRPCIDGVVSQSCVPGEPLALDDSTCDGVDEDCDGAVDEDYAGLSTTCGDGVCGSDGMWVCEGGTPVDTCEAAAPTVSVDASCDGVDDDCDGLIDEDFVGETVSCGTGACLAEGVETCSGGTITSACEPLSPRVG